MRIFILINNSQLKLDFILLIGSIQQINSELERDLMIRAVHDVKVCDNVLLIKKSHCSHQ